MRDPVLILDDLKAAAELGENAPVAELVQELDASALGYGEFPHEFVERLTALVQDQAFLGLEDSWKLAHFLGENWDLTTEQQREALRPVLVSIFSKHRSYMGAFVVGEVLGGRYCDAAMLESLVGLSQDAAMPALALVPHALETLARTSKDAALTTRATNAIRKLAGSANEEVRKEAGISLGKAGKPL